MERDYLIPVLFFLAYSKQLLLELQIAEKKKIDINNILT